MAAAAEPTSKDCPHCADPLPGPLQHEQSVVVQTDPDTLYEIISDVTRTGEWSPICCECWWDEGDGPRVGGWFTGRNFDGNRTWETRSQIVTAEPAREFAWLVGGKNVRWGYRLDPDPGGTHLTESWQFTSAGVRYFHDRYGAEAHPRMQTRIDEALAGIPATLAAIADAVR